MRKSLGAARVLPIFLSLALFISPLAPFASAATLTVTPGTPPSTYTNVVNVANRLVALQESSGSWNYDVTDATGPTGTGLYNIAGVTGESLLDAYALTGNTTYLTAAKKAGDFIVSASAPLASNDAAVARQVGYNPVFLFRLAEVSGTSSYATVATSIFNTVTGGNNYWSNNNGSFCGGMTGCTPEQLMSGFENYRSGNTTPNGVVAWDLETWVDAAMSVGTTTFATELADDITTYVTDPSYDASVDSYALGLASAVRAEVAAGQTPNETVVAALDAAQDISGSVGTTDDGQIQTTAYALMAFNAINDSHAAAAAAFLNDQIVTDRFVETGGPVEYSENDSEAARALSFGLPTNTQYSIQAAIDAAQPGDTIIVPAGTYNGFTVEGKTGITIMGAGKGSTIIDPTSLVATGMTHKYTTGLHSVVFVHNSSNVVIDGFTIKSNNVTPGPDGTANAIVFWDASTGSINNSAITGVYALSGAQTGQGIAVDASGTETSTLAVNNTDISGFQKNGIEAIDGNGTTGSTDTINVAVTGGSITGVGTTSVIAQNGVVIWNRGGGSVQGSIKNVVISGFTYSGDDNATGVLAYGGGNVTTISNSTLINNQLNVSTTMGSPAINATSNYWGSAAGPADETLDSTTTISFSPWYTDAAMTHLMFTTTSSTSTNTTTTTTGSSDVDQAATSSTPGVATTTVSIQAGTTITGDASWDGTIQELTLVSNALVTIPATDNSTPTVVSAIEVGNPGKKLILSNAARIVFEGQANKLVGWSLNGTFTPITAICSLDDQATEDASLADGADCAMNVGSDLVVWTKHFTTFATYTQAAAAASSGGGNGGGGGGGGSSPSFGDMNGDGHVNLADFSALMGAWGGVGANLAADFNHDGIVGILDFNILLANWGR